MSMLHNFATLPLLPFDAVRYLTDAAAIAENLTAVLEEGTPRLLALALADVARAKGVALGAVGDALQADASPTVETVWHVAKALGFCFAVQAV